MPAQQQWIFLRHLVLPDMRSPAINVQVEEHFLQHFYS